MKKKLGKVLVSLLAATMCFSAVGCNFGGGNGGGNSGNGGNGGNNESSVEDVNVSLGVKNPYKVKLFNFGAGYGREWLDTLITRYKKVRAGKEFTVDGVTYDGVDFTVTSDKTTMMSTLVDSNVPYDIVFHEQILYSKWAENYFSPITEVLTTANQYDNGKTIESKLSDEQKAYYKINGEYYGIPHYAGYVGISYNKAMFEENGWYFKADYTDKEFSSGNCFTKEKSKRSAGPDGVKGTDDDGLPTTYDEFFALCDVISDSDTDPISWTGKHRQEYLNWFITALTANYEGLDQMSLNYSYNGTATNLISVDANGNITKLDDVTINGKTNGEELTKQAGKYYALSFLEKIADEEWHTDTSYDDTTEQTTTQRDFVVSDASAMMVDGCWWEMESATYFDELQQVGGQDFKDDFAWMPLPCATKEEAAARATKMKNGGNGYTLVDTHNSLAFLSKNISAGAKEIAVDFLQFAYTDESLSEFSKITDTTKALQYTMSDADKAEMSAYGQSLVAIKEKSDIVYGFSTTAFYKTNLETLFKDYKNAYDCQYTTNSTAVSIAFDQFKQGKSAKEYFDGMYTKRCMQWSDGTIK